MTHSGFLGDEIPIFRGFTEIFVIYTVPYKNQITLSARDIQNAHLERYLRNRRLKGEV